MNEGSPSGTNQETRDSQDPPKQDIPPTSPTLAGRIETPLLEGRLSTPLLLEGMEVAGVNTNLREEGRTKTPLVDEGRLEVSGPPVQKDKSITVETQTPPQIGTSHFTNNASNKKSWVHYTTVFVTQKVIILLVLN